MQTLQDPRQKRNVTQLYFIHLCWRLIIRPTDVEKIFRRSFKSNIFSVNISLFP